MTLRYELVHGADTVAGEGGESELFDLELLPLEEGRYDHGTPGRIRRLGTGLLVVAALSAGVAIGPRLRRADKASSSEGESELTAHLSAGVVAHLQDKAALETWVQGAGFPSHAPPMDIDIEYQVDAGWGMNLDHIPDPETCAAMCQGDVRCKAYTWVKDAGLDDCPSQCWLKDAVGTKVPKEGVVSGVPPPRKELGAMVAPPPSQAGFSLYCFALMVPGSYEESLLRWQHDHKASIFGCDRAAVYSNASVEVASGVIAEVVDSDLKCAYGGDSSSALNAWIFIAVWHKVIAIGDYKRYDWIVKADPDTVFFPGRLSSVLKKNPDAGYINNCKYGMHGPIEVFSSRAVDSLAEDYKNSWDGKAPKRCVKEQHFGQWGEDMFIDQCLEKILQVSPRPTEPSVMCESHCDCPSWYWCNASPETVSYHPFKTVDAYENCLANSLSAQTATAAE